MLWHDNLLSRIKEVVDAALKLADDTVQQLKESVEQPGLNKPTESHRILQQRCPACFGRKQTGTPLAECVWLNITIDSLS
jgi:cytochrome c5